MSPVPVYPQTSPKVLEKQTSHVHLSSLWSLTRIWPKGLSSEELLITAYQLISEHLTFTS